MLWVRIPPEAALLFLSRKQELSSGLVALLCLVSLTELNMYKEEFGERGCLPVCLHPCSVCFRSTVRGGGKYTETEIIGQQIAVDVRANLVGGGGQVFFRGQMPPPS